MPRPHLPSRAALAASAVVFVPAAIALAQTSSGVQVVEFLRGGLSAACAPTMLCSLGSYGAQAVAEPGGALLPQSGPEAAPRQVVVTTAVSPSSPARPPVTTITTPDPVPQVGPVTVPLGTINESGLSPTFVTAAGVGVADTDGAITSDILLGLRGQYTLGGEQAGFAVVVVPQAAIRIEGRLTAEAAASAELAQDIPGEPRLQALNGSASASYALDSLTQLTAAAALSVTQDASDRAEGQATSVMTAPLEFTGDLNLGILRTVGGNTIGAVASLSRESTGDAILADGTVVTAPDSHLSRAGVGLRLGRELTPVFTAFLEGDAVRTDFDRVARDNWYTTASAGISGEWRTLEGEVSVGTGLRDYDSTALDDTQSLLFSASIAYAPRGDLSFGLAVDSALLPDAESESGVDARQSAVAMNAAYQASSWLGLTADASYLWELENDGDFVFERYGAGVGAELAWLPQATVNAGYAFTVTNRPTTPAVDEHRVTLGVTIEP